MSFISLLELATVSSGAFMNVSLLSAQNKGILVKGREIEAESTGQRNQSGLLFRVLILAVDEFESDDLFTLEFVLHQDPIEHSSVRGD